MQPEKIHRFTLVVLAATFLLIAAGGLVTSTESGLSVPDWPLSYGQVFPPMIGGIRFEHSHRVIAGTVGLLTLVLTTLLYRYEPRRWVQHFGLAALGAVVLQAVLGGLTVIYLLPKPVSIAHACLAQTFFCFIAGLAIFTSREWRFAAAPEVTPNSRSLRRLTVVACVFAYAQLVSGAVVRHTQGASGLPWHYFFAFMVFLHVLFILNKVHRAERTQVLLAPHSATIGLLVVLQIFLGFGALAFAILLKKEGIPPLAEVFFATAHQANGALILAGLFVLTLRTHRLFKP